MTLHKNCDPILDCILEKKKQTNKLQAENWEVVMQN